MIEALGPQFGETTSDWRVMAERGDTERFQVVGSPFALQIDKFNAKTIALDATTMPAGAMPIIEPKADRQVILDPKRSRTIRQVEPINADILLKPDMEQGILVNLERLRAPDLLNPERVQPGLTAPTRPGQLLRRESGKHRRDDQ